MSSHSEADEARSGEDGSAPHYRGADKIVFSESSVTVYDDKECKRGGRCGDSRLKALQRPGGCWRSCLCASELSRDGVSWFARDRTFARTGTTAPGEAERLDRQ